MIKLKPGANVPTPTRVRLIVLATVIGLILTLTVVMAQSLNFSFSYKIGPQYARPNDVITYTIVAVNTGDTLVPNVVLSDVLPSGLLFITDSCTYDYGYGSPPLSCDPLNKMWEIDFFPGTRITTTFAATVTAVTTGTLHLPLANHAYIGWDSGQQELIFTTTVLAAIPEFTLSYEPDPPHANTGGTITYTIVAVNNGDSVSDAVLSDALPGGVTFVPGSCTYDIAPPSGSLSLDLPCNTLLPGQRRVVWRENLLHGTRITTTFLVTVTVPEGSTRWPLPNCAYLGWSVIQEEICFTSLANPTVYVHLPLIMRHFGQDRYEPNDTPAQAYGPLLSGAVYRAYIWDAADQDDYYHFTPLADTSDVHVELTNIPANCIPSVCDYDLLVYYYNGQGYILVAESRMLNNLDENLTFTPVAGRQYYIRVYRFSGFNNEQPYGLKWEMID
jgi:uncharacterized repeat protein (TIGR01451 family)